MNLGFVCTNFNNTKYTREAVHSLVNTGYPFDIVIVDNNSDSENVQALKQLAGEFRSVDLVLNNENLGYFKGLNMGLRRLRIRCPHVDVIVIGNNDLVFPEEFAECILNNSSTFAQHAVVSPDIVTLDGTHQNPHVIAKIGTFRELMYDLYYTNYYLAIAIRKVAKLTEFFTDRPDERHHEVGQPIYQGHGACYVLGPLFFQHFEELWAPSFLMHEEYFLSKQLGDRGLHVYYEPSIRVIHHCHASIDQVPGKQMWQAGRDAHKIYRQHVKIFG